MIICLCEGVRDAEVTAAVKAGVCDLPSLARHCGAGRSCGSCQENLLQILHQHNANQSAHTTFTPSSSPKA